MGILGNIREVLKTLKRKKPSKIYCPKCTSPNIHLSDSINSWLGSRKYVCEDCGYSGPIIMEIEKEEV
jgi:predicted RNA-binding Zn-ribbon protein involved in translation (DUF1610 family)